MKNITLVRAHVFSYIFICTYGHFDVSRILNRIDIRRLKVNILFPSGHILFTHRDPKSTTP